MSQVEVESDFQPDPESLQTLLSMGIADSVAKEALFCTGNDSVEASLNYIFGSNISSNDSLVAEIGDGESERNSNKNDSGDAEEWEDLENPDQKMVFVVNQSLKMGVGKIAAQVAHACLGLYRILLEENDCSDEWEECGERKIVLKGNSTEHLKELYNKAKEARITAYLVRDAGHTQIPAGSTTVLGLFGSDSNVDEITGKLNLL